MRTGPQDPAGGDGLRASHADREQVIEALKDAFADGRLTRDELDVRTGRALAARTGAELAALTADVPAAAAMPEPTRPSAPARRRPLARAAAGSGGCLVIAAAAVWVAILTDPEGRGPDPYQSLDRLCFVVAFAAVLAALVFAGLGVDAWAEQRHSRRQLPPQPGPGGHALEAERRGGTAQGPVPPGSGIGQAHRAELRPDQSRPRRRDLRHIALIPHAANRQSG